MNRKSSPPCYFGVFHCLGSGHRVRSNIGHLWHTHTHTYYYSNTDRKASVPPWNSPRTVSTHLTQVLGVNDDSQSEDMNDGPSRRAQSRNISRSVFMRALMVVMQTHSKKQNYWLPLSHLWNTNGTRHYSPSRVNGSGRCKHHRETEMDDDTRWKVEVQSLRKTKNQLSERLSRTMDR